MPRKLSTWCVAFALTTVAVLVPATAHAAGIVDPAPIGPNQYFQGQVNGRTDTAVIQMACFGPSTLNQYGHPMAGQTVAVVPLRTPTNSSVGFTGSAANEVVVSFGVATTGTAVVLHDYMVTAAIPTSLMLPCYGTGQVTFIPEPTSSTARSATVTVSYVGQP